MGLSLLRLGTSGRLTFFRGTSSSRRLSSGSTRSGCRCARRGDARFESDWNRPLMRLPRSARRLRTLALTTPPSGARTGDSRGPLMLPGERAAALALALDAAVPALTGTLECDDPASSRVAASLLCRLLHVSEVETLRYHRSCAPRQIRFARLRNPTPFSGDTSSWNCFSEPPPSSSLRYFVILLEEENDLARGQGPPIVPPGEQPSPL